VANVPNFVGHGARPVNLGIETGASKRVKMCPQDTVQYWLVVEPYPSEK